eukprot:jgi/Undpi1/5539/HiC_scaffold_2.g00816.m1
MAPNRLSRNGDNGNTIRTSPPAAQLPMAQRSASVEAAGDAAGLPDVALTVFGEDKRPVLLYDGVCNMCNGFVNRFLDIDKEEKFRFSALQSETGRSLLALSGRSPEDISSIVLVEANGDAHIQSDALLRMGRILGGPVGMLLSPGVAVPKFVRNRMYDVVADNRYSFLGKREDCRCSDDRYADRFI